MTPSELQNFYDYTITEVAKELDLSVNTISRAQESGLEKVAKILAERGITAQDILPL